MNAIKQAFLGWNLDLAFNVTSDMQKKAPLYLKLENLTDRAMRINALSTELISEQRNQLANQLRRLIGPLTASRGSRVTVVIPPIKKRVKWSNEEKIRVLASRRMYVDVHGHENGIWSHVV